MDTAQPEVYRGGDIPGLALKRQGKVRDLIELPQGLLLITTDRISAFDVVLDEGIPDKGRVLTRISSFWFEKTKDLFPNHLITDDVDQIPEIPNSHKELLRGRILYGRKANVVPFEFIVRGYLSGSGFSSYKKDRTICGIPLPEGLENSSKLPEPIFTPTTKAEEGHDMPVTYEDVVAGIGKEKAEKLRDASLTLYNFAASYAAERGIIIADTKFEFGEVDGELILIDEVLTPDSSRFWPADEYAPGKTQPSFDKQIVRDYLNTLDWNKQPPPPPIPGEIIDRAAARYREIVEKLTGKAF